MLDHMHVAPLSDRAIAALFEPLVGEEHPTVPPVSAKKCTRSPRSARYPNALRACLRRAGYTFREVAKETGIPESTLHRWADGYSPIPQRERPRLAHLLGCEIEELTPQAVGASAPTLPVALRVIILGQTSITIDHPTLVAALEAGFPCYCVVIYASSEAQAVELRAAANGENLPSCPPANKPHAQIKYHRKVRGWTQVDLADRLYQMCEPGELTKQSSRVISAGMISGWERGAHIPSLFWQRKLCTLFATTLDQLGFLEERPNGRAISC